MKKLIAVRDLCVKYDERAVLRNVSFEICEGDFICVVGANGSGKSTLIKAILGLVRPAGGRVKLLNGLELRQLGYLPQETQFEKDFPASVEEVVCSGALGRMRWRPFYTKAERERAAECMRDLHIVKLAKRKIGELSGGQRQAITLLMATLKEPDLLLLDEHTAALDPKTAAKVLELTQQVVDRSGLTTIMVTHNMHDAIRLGNRLVMMADGRVIYDVRGEEKARLHRADLMAKFEEAGEDMSSDRMLLG
jgi:putative ABC transport system ATP-binding protein